jgi:hypothetical protein
MNFKPLKFSLALALLTLAAGCSTQPTVSGGHKTTLLGGVMTVSTKSYEPVPPATLDVDTTKLAGQGSASGTKVSVLWGLLTFHDY